MRQHRKLLRVLRRSWPRQGELVTVERFAGRWCIVARVHGTRGGGRVLVGGPRRCEVLRAGIHLVDIGRVC